MKAFNDPLEREFQGVRTAIYLLVLVTSLGAGCASSTSRPTTADLAETFLSIQIGDASSKTTDDFERTFVIVREKHVQECMSRAGFSYKPVDPDDPSIVPRSPDVVSFDYVRSKGFGIAASVQDSPPSVDPDPNAAALTSMSTAEQASFSLTMNGDGADGEGCAATGAKQARAELGIDTLQADYQRTDALVRSDTRYQAAVVAWQQCVRIKGFSYSEPAAPYTDFASKMSDFERDSSGVLTALGRTERNKQILEEVKVATDTFECYKLFRAEFRAIYESIK